MSRAATASMPSIETAFFLLLLTLSLYLVWNLSLRLRPRPKLRTVAILVLGDIGRSPRMMYHSESFANNKFLTYLVGYGGSQPIPSLLAAPNVSIIHLTELPNLIRELPFFIGGPMKVLHQVLDIVYTLSLHIPDPPEFILVQNPPSIPTLAIVWLVSKLRGCKVIIDWHNLGYTILALRLGQKHYFVKIAKWFEAYFGRSAYAHLFVTQAMRDYLVEEWDLQGLKIVLHDRPPSHFHRADSSEIHGLFQRLLPALTDPSAGLNAFLPDSNHPYSTPFTHIPPTSLPLAGAASLELGPYVNDIAMPTLRPDRPALIVSSTSWTPDEDFAMLLSALKEYERRARASAEKVEGESLPKLLAIVTGKGPLKEKYMQEVQRLQTGNENQEVGPWRFVRCISLWLEADDYPLLLGSADVGVSLHSSSSALDLPMKVVDMFGCGLPVCALGFDCLDELVKDGTNGLVFHNAEQLALQIESLLRGFPSAPALASLRSSFERRTSVATAGGSMGRNDRAQEWEWGTWAENWDRAMRPVLLTDVASEAKL